MTKSAVQDLDSSNYETELRALQIELVKVQKFLIANGNQILVILEGRDAAGKDGTIKAITEHLSPRETRVVALASRPMWKQTNGTFSATSPSYLNEVSSSSLIGAGTTGLALRW